jgi:hypothetical protein
MAKQESTNAEACDLQSLFRPACANSAKRCGKFMQWPPAAWAIRVKVLMKLYKSDKRHRVSLATAAGKANVKAESPLANVNSLRSKS